MNDLSSAVQRLKSWFVGRALPLWAAKGYDEARGGFYEALNFDASPSDGRPRRTRAQARQIHTFTQAALRGWLPEGEALAAKGFDYFLKTACPDEGARGCVHRIEDDGGVIDPKRDLYDQAFLLLAAAARIEAAQDPRALTLADNTIDFLARELHSPHGGWLESDAGELPRRQNPHMHLFEALLALHRVTADEKFLALADEIYDLFCARFYDPSVGVLNEKFHADWSIINGSAIEPGHMVEWIWLLRAYHARRGHADAAPDTANVSATLYERARTLGGDTSFHGFLVNVCPADGAGGHGAKRLWPQSEFLRAALVIGDEATAAGLIAGLFDTYLAADIDGLWIDEFDAHGLRAAKDVPSSILYHLFEAVAEADAHMQTISQIGAPE